MLATAPLAMTTTPSVTTTPRLSEVIAEQLDRLVDWADLPTARWHQLRAVLSALGTHSLDRPATPPFSGLSQINANGLPWQWSFSLGRERGRDVRFLCEVGTPGASIGERTVESLTCFHDLCRLLEIPRPDWFDAVVVPELVPSDAWPEHWRSAMWMAVGASRDGVMARPYFNLNRETPDDRWRSIGRLLLALGRLTSLERWCAVSSQVSSGSLPVGAAIDVLPDGSPGRLKVYFRSEAVGLDWLARWYRAAGGEGYGAEVRRLIELLGHGGAGPYPEQAFFVSLELHPDGEVSLKTDLAITHWLDSDARVVAATTRFLREIGGGDDDYLAGLEALGIHPSRVAASDPERCAFHRLVGLGFEPSGETHVNVYVEPPLDAVSDAASRMMSRSRPRSFRPVDDAVERASRFLVARQQADGHWSDFSLPVGRATSWVTAYVVERASRVPAPPRTLTKALARARRTLLVNQSPGGGWGYHPDLPPDADSSSLACLALRSADLEPPPGALLALDRCRNANGTFGTYDVIDAEGPGWAATAWDVTPYAWLALDDEIDDDEAAVAASIATHAQTLAGVWRAYWWRSDLYATLGMVTWLRRRSLPIPREEHLLATLRAWTPVGVFETALLAELFFRLRSPVMARRVCQRLLDSQRADGSWPTQPILRLTDPQVVAPWHTIDAGAMFEDQAGVFTAATVLGALSFA